MGHTPAMRAGGRLPLQGRATCVGAGDGALPRPSAVYWAAFGKKYVALCGLRELVRHSFSRASMY